MAATKDKGIKQLGKNLWLVRAVGKCPKTGRRKEAERQFEGTLTEAREHRRQLKEELSLPPVPERQRLRTYARSWLATRLPALKPSTAKKYADALDLHVLPVLGEYFVDALTPSDVSDYLAGKSKLAGNTRLNQLRLLRTIAKDALAEGITDRDFCARVKAPTDVRVYTDEDPNLLSAEQLARLLLALPPQWAALVGTLAFTGLRWGEVTALRWSDLDTRAGLIHVRRSNWKGTIVTPKTDKRRTVPMDGELLHVLVMRYQQLALAGRRPRYDAWIFPTRSGGLHKGSPLRKVLRAALKTAKIETDLTPHGLRRTLNDLVRRVANREVTKAITGHATDAMLEHYSQVDAGEKLLAQRKVRELLTGQPAQRPLALPALPAPPDEGDES